MSALRPTPLQIISRLLGRHRRLEPECNAEATAIIRRAGAWAVYLGRRGILTRFYQRENNNPAFERRLGVIATCIGELLADALEYSGDPSQVIRVVVRSVQETSPSSNRARGAVLFAHVAAECDADPTTAQSCCDRHVPHHPLFRLLTRDFHSVQISVHTESRMSPWIC